MRRSTRFTGTLAASAAFAILGSSSMSLAATGTTTDVTTTTIGMTSDTAAYTCTGPGSGISVADSPGYVYGTTVDGTLRSWTTVGSSVGSTATRALEVWRPIEPGKYKLMHRSPSVTLNYTGPRTYTLSPALSMSAGDRLGFHYTGVSVNCANVAPESGLWMLGTPEVGSTYSFSLESRTSALNLSAELVPDSPDNTPPTITPSVSPSDPDGRNGWYTGKPAVAFEVTDAESPVTSRTGCDSTTVAADTSGATFTCSATSTGGTLERSVTIKRDATAPTAAFDGSIGPAVFGAVPAAPTCTATDGLSGPAGCAVTGYSTAVGTHTLTATATDLAGNTAQTTSTYTVAPWTSNGFYEPVDMGNVFNTVKGGSTVPMKFEAFAGSTELTSPTAVSSFTTRTVACPGATAAVDAIETITTGGTSLRYDSTAGQFIQNWQTPKKPGTCVVATVTLQDGTELSANFQLK